VKAALPQRLAAEALGTALLVATVVGSGVMGETLTKDTALVLLANTLPTGAILVVLITILGPISGANFNPAVSLVFALKRDLAVGEAALYAATQIVAGILGTIIAHLTFALPMIETSLKMRTGAAMVRRVGRDLRLDRYHSRWNPLRSLVRAVVGRSLYHRCLLVHRLHLVCESRRGDSAFSDQHLFRHPPY
jgi:glycerol uptake facilitator-like aquaporin